MMLLMMVVAVCQMSR